MRIAILSAALAMVAGVQMVTVTLSLGGLGGGEYAEQLWLRSTWGFNGISQFSYSVDGKYFVPYGTKYQLTWRSYRGDRVGVFTYGPGGYVDVQSFQYKIAH